MTSKKNILPLFGSGEIQSTWCGHAWFRQEERAQRLTFWVRTPPSRVGSSTREGEGRKARSLPRKLGSLAPKPRVKQTLCLGCPGNSAGTFRTPGIVQTSDTLEPLRNTANGIFQRKKPVDIPPWGLLAFAGNPVTCAVGRRPGSGKDYRRIL